MLGSCEEKDKERTRDRQGVDSQSHIKGQVGGDPPLPFCLSLKAPTRPLLPSLKGISLSQNNYFAALS